MRALSSLESIPHPDAQTGLAQWRELTRQANAAFDRRQFAHAQRLYRHALQTALALIASPAFAACPDDCLAALVVAHHNVSETHRQRRDPAGTLEHLCLPHEALTRIAADPHVPDDARRCAVRHMSRTRLALLDWQTRHGACAKTQALLRDGLSALSSLGDVALH
ncbi:hypothetical protein [Lysobacter capsici]|uniref:hypothetical protein n=1 Tax=Lysobacter capsici TaxID=435897 RepID=UPI001BFFF1F0|nr:hypothetical protein [Lysobacter capsici]QWF16522.1 hypothetical protein KME82_22675 [Lysobacter capsici]